MMGCMNRLQTFFNLPESEILNSTGESTISPLDEHQGTEDLAEKGQGGVVTQISTASSAPAIGLSHVSVSPSEDRGAILIDVNVTIDESTFAMLLGPTGCGKSTLLRSFVGAANVTEGTITKCHNSVAYCGQTPWIENISIRDNIIGELDFDPVAYETVVNACMLQDDFLRLPNGDRTLAGSNGSRLSGGQKHRVVRTSRYTMLRCQLIFCRHWRELCIREHKSSS